jgi:serine/threonine protein kinase
VEERNNLVICNHPFIVKLYYCFQNVEKLYFVLEYLEGGDLHSYLEKYNRLTEKEAKFIVA